MSRQKERPLLQQPLAPAGGGRRNTDEKARRGDDAIVRAQHRGSEPAYARYPVPLCVSMIHVVLFMSADRSLTTLTLFAPEWRPWQVKRNWTFDGRDQAPSAPRR